MWHRLRNRLQSLLRSLSRLPSALRLANQLYLLRLRSLNRRRNHLQHRVNHQERARLDSLQRPLERSGSRQRRLDPSDSPVLQLLLRKTSLLPFPNLLGDLAVNRATVPIPKRRALPQVIVKTQVPDRLPSKV